MSIIATEVGFRQAATACTDPALALLELDRALHFKGSDAVILFVSPQYDLQRLAAEIQKHIHVPLLCCTTAGEISSSLGYSVGGIAAASISGCRARLVPFPRISRGADALAAPLAESQQFLSRDDPTENLIGLVVLDGLCRREESVIEQLQLAMPTVPIVGGSAGDACQFKQTLVYIDGQFQTDAGALLLVGGGFSAIPFQTHHFVSSGMRVVATQVDAPNRRLIQLDGLPAAVRLSQILGMGVEDVTADRLTTRPLMLRCGDYFFVRGVQAVHADGSLSFYSALREGEILHIGKAAEIVDVTASYFEALRHQKSTPDLVLGFDCIQRRIELSLRGMTTEMNAVLRQVPFAGFSTFGEQCHGQHVNQTMTGVALWKQ